MSTRAATFLDSNSGAPLHPNAVKALLSILSEPSGSFGNPSSIHTHGRRTRRLMAEAWRKIARSLSSHPETTAERLVLTSSGSEANQQAIRSALEPLLDRGEPVHWITSAVEHDSTLQMVEWVRNRGGLVDILPVNSQGLPDPALLKSIWRPETRLVSLIWVNNETGVVLPLEDWVRAVRELGGSLHLDAAQAWGKLPIDLSASGADYVSFSGHKIGGLAGSGILWYSDRARFNPLLPGKQQKDRRGGTESWLSLVALGAAAEAVDPEAWSALLTPVRDRLERGLRERITGVLVNGDGAPRVANTVSLTFDGVDTDGMVAALDLRGFSVSSGSACAAGVAEPSHVLLAMGRTPRQARSSLRVSFSEALGDQELERFTEAVEQVVTRFRK